MHWTDEIANQISGLQVVNDSKTPSGRVHVGALRGVLIHDAVFRTLKAHHIPARYLFGVDDYDPLDELPAGQQEFYRPYLGAPLCNVPAPQGADAPDMATYYMREFFGVFEDLGVEVEAYWMRNVYRSGQFNEVIDTFLRHASKVRQIYREVSGAQRPESWYPLQVICEQCGRIGTTEVLDYDGQEVTYRCRSDLVRWARGCEYQGKCSPFDGRGKLPWKLEWAAKWRTFSVTIEGAGKDHSTKGSSRDVAAECLRAIWGQEPPLHIPYEFFLVGGSKMSSSKGIGVSAREIANLLPPDLLRFLVLRTPPNRAVNFAPDLDNISKLFNDFDQTRSKIYEKQTALEDERRAYELAETAPEGNYAALNFSLILTWIQVPHIDVAREFEKRKGASLTPLEHKQLAHRIDTARYWLDHFAREEERITLQPTLPASAAALTAREQLFLQHLAEALIETPWEDEAIQRAIFTTAQSTPIEPSAAFAALYRIFLDHPSGPRAGSLLAVLDPSFVTKRLAEPGFGPSPN